MSEKDSFFAQQIERQKIKIQTVLENHYLSEQDQNMKILLISFSLLISLSSFSSTGIDCLVNDGNPHKSLEIKEFSQAEFASFDYDNSYFIGVTLLQKGEYIYNVGVYNNAPKELVYRVYHVDNEGKKTLEFYISENGKGYLESSTHLSHVKNDVAVSCEYKNH